MLTCAPAMLVVYHWEEGKWIWEKMWYLYSCVSNLFFPNIHWDEMRECVRVYGAVWSEERCRKSKLLTISLSIFFLEHNPFMFFWVMLKYHVVWYKKNIVCTHDFWVKEFRSFHEKVKIGSWDDLSHESSHEVEPTCIMYDLKIVIEIF